VQSAQVRLRYEPNKTLTNTKLKK